MLAPAAQYDARTMHADGVSGSIADRLWTKS